MDCKNKQKKRSRRSRRGSSGKQVMVKKGEEDIEENCSLRTFKDFAEAFYCDNIVAPVPGYKRELLVVSWLRQFRRITVDDLVLAGVIQNFLGFPKCMVDSACGMSEKELLDALDKSLDFDIDAMFAEIEGSHASAHFVPYVPAPRVAAPECESLSLFAYEMPADPRYTFCEPDLRVCYSPDSSDSFDPFVGGAQWDPESSPSLEALARCNPSYSPRDPSPPLPSSDEVSHFAAGNVQIPVQYGAEFPQYDVYGQPSPFFMYAADNGVNDGANVGVNMSMNCYYDDANTFPAQPQVYQPPVPMARPQTNQYVAQTPRPSPPPPTLAPPTPPPPPPAPKQQPAPRFDFNAMRVTDIVRQRFTMPELVEHNLLERLLTDQNGSKYVQSRLKQQFLDNKEECSQCVGAVLHHLMRVKKIKLAPICEDMYGNYSIQLLFMCGSPSQRKEMVRYFVIDSILRLSRSKFGCRVIQEILKEIGDQQIVSEMAAAFRMQCEQNPGTLAQCVQCCNVNRVLQVLIQLKLPFTEMKFLADELNSDLVRFSEDRNACRVLQSFVKIYGDKIDIKQLLSNKAHLYLAETVHGNYVIQCLAKKNEWYSKQETFVAFRNKLIYDIFGEVNLEYFSKHKQGSNVIEECIRSSTPKQISYLTNILCKTQGSLLRKLMRDKFGNYVPKTLLKYANRKQQFCIANTVHTYIANLKNYHLSHFKHCAEFIDVCSKIQNQLQAYKNK
eukprot:CAMPEP_0202685232 /NCGR_PEP_ID=MMETSP1385-20130828/971_1 /ASSEMBLY_ACC=CAM_ASM_000861 /TAXON_ID=933848 /ORGANISM="Elphidium margaritaceum" /LENGTH=726 /DNA_ID=CAMNT_0049339543 /DNA_START=21 /DNA_END=2201 /DNA_ORIENTATION=+